MSTNPSVDMASLKQWAQTLRLDVLDITTKYGGHLTSCFSCVEILTVLYFGHILRYRAAEPHWAERDRFILSKGHAAPLLYSVLARAGYFPLARLSEFRQVHSGLHGHPIQDAAPGVEVSAGSLGQGLSFGLGHVLAGRLQRLDFRVYVLLGDGECEEGQVWEAAMAAAHFRADRLTAIVDFNKLQQTGPIAQEMALEPFAEKWQAFGWHVLEADGHDVADVAAKLKAAQVVAGRPQVVLAHTIKGKGVSFIENDHTMHGRALSGEKVERARKEIACA